MGNSQGDGPLAIKTLLGWVVSGSFENWKGKHEQHCHVANVNRVCVEHRELLLEKYCEHDLNEKAAEELKLKVEEAKEFQSLQKRRTGVSWTARLAGEKLPPKVEIDHDPFKLKTGCGTGKMGMGI